MNNQLTKKQLQNLEVGKIITEKLFNETYNWKVDKIDNDVQITYHLSEITTNKKSKLIVSENFNKEGDRKYKSSKGSIIVKYYSYGEN